VTDGGREGTLTELSVDVAGRVVVLHVHLRLGQVEAEHVLRLEEVGELVLDTPAPAPWASAALTGLRSAVDPGTGEWVVELVLWDPGTRLRVRCATVRLDGMPVDPTRDAASLPSM